MSNISVAYSSRVLCALGFSLALVGGLSGRTPRHIVDDEAYTRTATEGAEKLHGEGKLVALSALLAQPPSKEPLKFAAPAKELVAPTELYDRLRAGTVAIGAFYHCHECDNWHLDLATGFAVAEGGVVSTCAHVFAYDEDEMKDAFAVAVDAEGRAFPVEAMLAKDEESDTCLVRVAGAKLRALPLRAGALPGERVFCMSHPNGHYFMFSQGIVARVSRSSTMPADEDAEEHPKSRPTLTLEVTSEYSPGSSGGPIADENGNVIAQVDLIVTDTDTDNGTSGIVAARTATAAEEILRLANPANRPALKPAGKIDTAEALAALKNAVDALEASEDDDAYDPLLAKVARAVKRGHPAMTEPAQRREFALLAAGALSDDTGNKVLKKLIPMLEEIGDLAKESLAPFKAKRALQGVPLELKFTALDGTEMDVAKLRGKVVLIDFWATWCGPCMEELPEVKKIYESLHARGFEIVGISLDEDRKKLEAVLKNKGMTWPQHFDGKSWDGPLVKRFGITGIPALWLLDKKGVVKDMNARGADLGAKIEKLLAE